MGGEGEDGRGGLLVELLYLNGWMDANVCYQLTLTAGGVFSVELRVRVCRGRAITHTIFVGT